MKGKRGKVRSVHIYMNMCMSYLGKGIERKVYLYIYILEERRKRAREGIEVMEEMAKQSCWHFLSLLCS